MVGENGEILTGVASRRGKHMRRLSARVRCLSLSFCRSYQLCGNRLERTVKGIYQETAAAADLHNTYWDRIGQKNKSFRILFAFVRAPIRNTEKNVVFEIFLRSCEIFI